jgi:phosphoglycolate phosphatase-like HAD superfamily hydrolase
VTRRLVLWDIDNTLIDNGGVSKAIYAGAFELLTGRQPENPPKTGGRTDQRIMAELLTDNGEPEGDWCSTRSALVNSGRENAASLGVRGRVLPGVQEVMAVLHRDHPNVVQTIVTGNIIENAAVKLGAFGLLRFVDLDVGGFGSDHPRRPELVALAIRRAAAKYLDPDDTPRVFVVGDTPRDVRAGHGSGAVVLAVASGIHNVRELREAGADHVVTDLSDVDAVTGVLLRDAARD